MALARHPSGTEARRGRERKRLAAIAAGAVCLLLLASATLWLLGTPPRATASVGGPFRLSASNGRIIDNRSFPGRYKLLYFGYTHCRDICPTTLAALAGALQMLGQKADRIQPLFVTVDPERDTATVLRTYLAGFTPRLLGLTGTPKQIAAIERAYRVTSIVHPTASGGYDLDHSSVLYLMGPNGRFVAPLRADEPAAAMAATLARYLS
jgi:protein SCO1/2